MQYVKIVETLEQHVFKNYTVDSSLLYQHDGPEMLVVDIPRKPTDAEVLVNPTIQDIYQLQHKEYIKEERILKVSLKSM